MTTDGSLIADRELIINRVIDAPAASVYRAWTEPGLLKQWFTPPPYRTTHADLDVRVGGSTLVVMEGPDGKEMPNRGVYLEVVQDKRIVFTNAYVNAWEPSTRPFITIDLTFEDIGGKTNYTARVMHWSIEDRIEHEKMGFYTGWGISTDQLATVAGRL